MRATCTELDKIDPQRLKIPPLQQKEVQTRDTGESFWNPHRMAPKRISPRNNKEEQAHQGEGRALPG